VDRSQLDGLARGIVRNAAGAEPGHPQMHHLDQLFLEFDIAKLIEAH
jgi:hypothetical protein